MKYVKDSRRLFHLILDCYKYSSLLGAFIHIDNNGIWKVIKTPKCICETNDIPIHDFWKGHSKGFKILFGTPESEIEQRVIRRIALNMKILNNDIRNGVVCCFHYFGYNS